MGAASHKCLTASLICLSLAQPAWALPAPTASQQPDDAPPSTPLPDSQLRAPPPLGLTGFCVRDPGQCLMTDTPARMTLTEANWTLMRRVNREVNDNIAPISDIAHYGRKEYWTIPTDGWGDCEDYALAKRADLMAAGLPENALRMAVVRTFRNALHAVLVVATDRGDYVLDSLETDVEPWKDEDYGWIEEQGPHGPRDWVALESPQRIAQATRQPTSALPRFQGSRLTTC